MNACFDARWHDVVGRAERLARDRFAGRAAEYDRTAQFPATDFDDLFHEGLHALAIPTPHGGLGLGLDDGLFAVWMVINSLAKADMSLARCWEGHVNSQVLIRGMGDAPQQARWFEGMVDRGEKWVVWSRGRACRGRDT
jgi:alkylation response protein AidB-like acyl-CoA dehydrogenase